MNIHQWAIKWGVPAAALADLEDMTGTSFDAVPPPLAGMSEAAVTSHVRLRAPKLGITLWRNNVGALLDEGGRPVRYGLANETKAMNERFKSADYVGIRKLTITPAHVGTVVGQFASVEMKAGDWRYAGTEREVAQLEWARHVQARGGWAIFCNDPSQLG